VFLRLQDHRTPKNRQLAAEAPSDFGKGGAYSYLGGKMRIRILGVVAPFILASIVVNHANALEVAVVETRINVSGPKGYCAMDKKNPHDREMLAATQELLKGRNELLAIYAACDKLASWRAGKIESPGDNAQYQVSIQNKAKQFAAETIIPALCAESRKNGDSVYKGVKGEMNKRFDSVSATAAKLKVNDQQFYGVLQEDKTGCYIGVLQKLEINGKVATMFIVQVFTVVKGKLLFFNFGNEIDGPGTAQRVLETSRATLAATFAQN